MGHLPYRQLDNGRAAVDEQVLIAAFADSEITYDISAAERFCTLTHQGVSWTVVNFDLISTVTADENNSGYPITRIIDRPLTHAMFAKVVQFHTVP
ncbi:hypothetical protein J7E88_12995 [Streptomyces sp. ISL-10]|uniref:hypothetical protein n=1 Tax=Streptomyces sp. ISL-10 TaxID=2819172 RepID=UPI001BE910AA|nr:hypothetical protein [Streptomyces sp. ISL-10]MBT2366201.1 hypothetical protein [Streptomyces sp. ISL-10]